MTTDGYVTALQAYNTMHAYFSRAGAVLAKDGWGGCKYRTEDGNKCAVGCLIPDEIFDLPPRKFDDFDLDERFADNLGDQLNRTGSIDSLFGHLDRFPELKNIINGGDDSYNKADAALKADLLRKAQRLHDSLAKDAKDFTRLLQGLALGLNIIV